MRSLYLFCVMVSVTVDLETMRLCLSVKVSLPPFSISIANFSSALLTSVNCHIMGAAPTLESVLHQSSM